MSLKRLALVVVLLGTLLSPVSAVGTWSPEALSAFYSSPNEVIWTGELWGHLVTVLQTHNGYTEILGIDKSGNLKELATLPVSVSSATSWDGNLGLVSDDKKIVVLSEDFKVIYAKQIETDKFDFPAVSGYGNSLYVAFANSNEVTVVKYGKDLTEEWGLLLNFSALPAINRHPILLVATDQGVYVMVRTPGKEEDYSLSSIGAFISRDGNLKWTLKFSNFGVTAATASGDNLLVAGIGPSGRYIDYDPLPLPIYGTRKPTDQPRIMIISPDGKVKMSKELTVVGALDERPILESMMNDQLQQWIRAYAHSYHQIPSKEQIENMRKSLIHEYGLDKEGPILRKVNPVLIPTSIFERDGHIYLGGYSVSAIAGGWGWESYILKLKKDGTFENGVSSMSGRILIAMPYNKDVAMVRLGGNLKVLMFSDDLKLKWGKEYLHYHIQDIAESGSGYWTIFSEFFGSGNLLVVHYLSNGTIDRAMELSNAPGAPSISVAGNDVFIYSKTQSLPILYIPTRGVACNLSHLDTGTNSKPTMKDFVFTTDEGAVIKLIKLLPPRYVYYVLTNGSGYRFKDYGFQGGQGEGSTFVVWSSSKIALFSTEGGNLKVKTVLSPAGQITDASTDGSKIYALVHNNLKLCPASFDSEGNLLWTREVKTNFNPILFKGKILWSRDGKVIIGRMEVLNQSITIWAYDSDGNVIGNAQLPFMSDLVTTEIYSKMVSTSGNQILIFPSGAIKLEPHTGENDNPCEVSVSKDDSLMKELQSSIEKVSYPEEKITISPIDSERINGYLYERPMIEKFKTTGTVKACTDVSDITKADNSTYIIKTEWSINGEKINISSSRTNVKTEDTSVQVFLQYKAPETNTKPTKSGSNNKTKSRGGICGPATIVLLPLWFPAIRRLRGKKPF